MPKKKEINYTGVPYRAWNEEKQCWEKYSFQTEAEDVTFDDGTSVEAVNGEIKDINSDIKTINSKLTSHTHNYAGSKTAGGSANTALTCTGNAATATALVEPKTINGVSFNGTKDITVADSTKLPLTGGTLTGTLNFANGTTYYVNSSAYAKFPYLGLGGNTPTTSYGLYCTSARFTSSAYFDNNVYFAGGTYYVSSAGNGKIQYLGLGGLDPSSSYDLRCRNGIFTNIAYFGSTKYYVMDGYANFSTVVADIETTDIYGSSQIVIRSNTGSILFSARDGSTTNTAVCVSDGAFRVSATSGKSPVTLGASNYRWGTIYSSSSTISTSDRNQKKNIEYLDETSNAAKYEALYMKLQPCTYMFTENTSKRTHTGFISQDIEEALDEVELSPLEFAAFCKDKKVNCTVDEDGNEAEEVVPGEYEYSLRYEEFIALNTHMIQKTMRRMDELEQKLADAEKRIAELETNQSLG